jgi:hypothetical protein
LSFEATLSEEVIVSPSSLKRQADRSLAEIIQFNIKRPRFVQAMVGKTRKNEISILLGGSATL